MPPPPAASVLLLDHSMRGRVTTQQPTPWPRDLRGALVLTWIVTIHITALVGLIFFPMPGWRLLISALTLLFLGGLGATICYHRALAHRSITLHPLVQGILIMFAMVTGVTPPRTWIPNHRYHHSNADSPQDPSSPVQRGFWIAHVAWYWEPQRPIPPKYAADLGSFSLRIWDWLTLPLFLAAFFGGALFSLKGFFWLGAIRLVLAFQANSLVNSVCHTEQHAARKRDSSRNVWWVAFPLLFLGENWHRDHHISPGSARLGSSWRQIDLAYPLILGLQRIGLAKNIHCILTYAGERTEPKANHSDTSPT